MTTNPFLPRFISCDSPLCWRYPGHKKEIVSTPLAQTPRNLTLKIWCDRIYESEREKGRRSV